MTEGTPRDRTRYPSSISGPNYSIRLESDHDVVYLIQVLRLMARPARRLHRKPPVSFPWAGMHALRDGLARLEAEA